MRAYIRALLRHRRLAAIALLGSMGLALYSARTIDIRFQFRDFYDYPANERLPLFKQTNAQFGDPAGYVVLMLEAADVFQPEVLGYVDRITRALEPLAAFSRVRSLTNVSAIRGVGDEVVTGPLIPSLAQTQEQMAAIKSFALQSPLLAKRIVSSDGTATAVLAQMRIPVAFATVAQQEAAVAEVARVLATNPAPRGIKTTLTGAPTIEIGTTNALVKDQLVMVPMACAALALMLFIMFRSMHGIVLCLASVGTAVLWTAGLFALAGRPVDLIGSMVPVTMLVYGVVDPIFVLARFLAKIDTGRTRDDAIVETYTELGLPCFLTSLTTSIGFAAFVSSVSPSLRTAGLTAGTGVLLSFVTTVTVLPLLLALLNPPKRKLASARGVVALDRALQALGSAVARRPVMFSFVAVMVLAAGALFGRVQHISNAYVGSLPTGQTQDDVRRFEQKLSGVVRLTVLLEGPADAIKKAEVVQAIARVDQTIERNPLVRHAYSLADLVSEVNQAFASGDPSQRKVPATSSLLGQYLSLIDPTDRADVVSDDYARSQIAVLALDGGSESIRALESELERIVAAEKFDKLGVRSVISGATSVAYGALDSVVVEVLYGFITAFGLVIVFEWLLFRSWRMALLSIVPNLIPIAACFCATRALGIPLRIDTVLMLCISIGGLFNTTIHFIARTLQQISEGTRDPGAIVVSSLRTIGPPSLFTTLVLSVGFCIFTASSFPGMRLLGLLSMLGIIAGFVSDMMFTPAFVRAGYDWNHAFKTRTSTPSAPAALPTT